VEPSAFAIAVVPHHPDPVPPLLPQLAVALARLPPDELAAPECAEKLYEQPEFALPWHPAATIVEPPATLAIPVVPHQPDPSAPQCASAFAVPPPPLACACDLAAKWSSQRSPAPPVHDAEA
jgi:hypothetical protein